MLTPDYEFQLIAQGYRVVGIDEVGRGCWAGPLVMAAYQLNLERPHLPGYRPIAEVRDSKRLSAKKRLVINETAAVESAAGLARTELVSKSARYINRYGLAKALKASVADLVERFLGDEDAPPPIFLIDGIYKLDHLGVEYVSLVKGDDKIYSIALASIIAKVWRDNYMKRVAGKYPGFGFANHVGYGTPGHIEALRSLGITGEHRLNYKPIQQFQQLHFATKTLRFAV